MCVVCTLYLYIIQLHSNNSAATLKTTNNIDRQIGHKNILLWRVTGSKPEINYRFIGNWCHCRTCEIYSSTHSHTIHNAMVANNTQLYKILHYTKFTKRISIEQAIPAFYLFIYYYYFKCTIRVIIFTSTLNNYYYQSTVGQWFHIFLLMVIELGGYIMRGARSDWCRYNYL